MTSNAEHQGQPALWDGSVDDRTSRVAPRTRALASSGVPDRAAASMESSELWSIDDVAGYLGVPKQTVYAWRTARYGPQGFRVGKHLRWRAATVVAWTVEMERGQ